jgi:glutamate-1-semialdehyde 2,1-aminomutase
MVDLATRYTDGVRQAIDRTGAGWSVAQLGARAEYRFAYPPPKTGSASAAAGDPELEDYFHVYMANRGVLITPFHNMALMSPATTVADVDRHTELFSKALATLAS